MRDNDSRILEEKYESLYAGKIEEDDTSLDAISKGDDNDKEDKDDKKDDKKEDKKEDKEDSKDSEESKDDSKEDSDKSDDGDDGEDKDSDSKDDDSEESSDDSDNDSDKDSDDSDDSEEDSDTEGNSAVQNKVKQLQKQYNDLLVDAFETYAAECIENALNGVESSFGENISDILDSALQELKSKILADLGVEVGSVDGVIGGAVDGAIDGEEGMEGAESEIGGIGGMDVDLGDKSNVKFGPKVGGVPTMSIVGDETNDDADDEDGDGVSECSCKKNIQIIEMKKRLAKKVLKSPDKYHKHQIDKANKASKETVKESSNIAKFYGFID